MTSSSIIIICVTIFLCPQRGGHVCRGTWCRADLALTCGEEMKKAQRIDVTDYDTSRLLNTILNLYYVEERTQAEIARQLALSTAKVNRLLHLAREQGFVDITIRTPSQHLFDLENPLKAVFGLQDALVIPAVPDESVPPPVSPPLE